MSNSSYQEKVLPTMNHLTTSKDSMLFVAVTTQIFTNWSLTALAFGRWLL